MSAKLYCFVILAAALAGGHASAFQSTSTPDRAEVRGLVRDASTGAPIAGVRLRLQVLEDPDSSRTTRSDDQGRYEFTQLPRQTVTIRPELPGYIQPGTEYQSRPGLAIVHLRWPSSNPGPRCPTCPLMGTSRVDANGVMQGELDLELIRYGVIAGQVTAPDGTPLVRAQVQLWKVTESAANQSGRPLPGTARFGEQQAFAQQAGNLDTDDRGVFRFAPLSAGTYFLAASAPLQFGWPPNFRRTFFGGSLAERGAAPLVVTSGSEIQASVRIVSERGVHVSGRVDGAASRVRDGFRRMAMLAFVPLREPSDSPFRTAARVNLDRDSFDVADILPGRYRLVATLHEWPSTAPNNLDAALAGVATLEADIGPEGLSGLSLALSPPLTVTGTVSFPAGCERSDLTLRVIGGPGGIGLPRRILVKGNEPHFQLTGVIPGPLSIYAEPSGASSAFVTTIFLGDQPASGGVVDVPAATPGELRIQASCSNQGRPVR